MPSRKHKPEEIISKLREVEIVLAQGASTAIGRHADITDMEARDIAERTVDRAA